MSTPIRRRIQLTGHLESSEIFSCYRNTTVASERTQWQVIYLKSQGRTVREIAMVTGYSESWIRQVIHRYNADGPADFIVQSLPTDPAFTKLKADHARQSKELDTARKTQQAMLEVPIPSHPDLEIAVFSSSASEVTGDYYDFHLSDRGILTIAVGDATGHGARAGIMVTATKSLFKALGHSPDLLQLVRTLTATLKSLNLRGLYMHLTLGRYYKGMLDLVVAGMPPALLHRHEDKSVHAVLLKGMPLGSFPEFPYQRCSVELKPGDTALLMSDGLPELVNLRGERLGGNRVQEWFEKSAGNSARSVVHVLDSESRAWSQGRAPEDDITILVLRRRV